MLKGMVLLLIVNRIISTTVWPSTPYYEGQRHPCDMNGTCAYRGPTQAYPQCIDGYCECNSTDYSRFSCLPSVGSCIIRENDFNNLHATPKLNGSRDLGGNSIYSCIGDGGDRADVHVLGVYGGNSTTRHPDVGRMDVTIIPSPSTSYVILVLSSFEPITWHITYPASLNLAKFILYQTTFPTDIDVTVVGSSSYSVWTENRYGKYGYGDDTGGGATADILRAIEARYGTVTSFAGTYRADYWDWRLPEVNNDTVEQPDDFYLYSEDYSDGYYIYRTTSVYTTTRRAFHGYLVGILVSVFVVCLLMVIVAFVTIANKLLRNHPDLISPTSESQAYSTSKV